ncbi:Mu transposase C-terminal domain-containing protein [Niabella insulamsoli]|uniref:Mu transposase C-terminal domain-containing protein n=1 Tax=Niabella insulamsoli TaxID=3144874 RepID=UPI0031FC4FEA
MQDFFYQHKELGICLTVKGLKWLGYADGTLKSAFTNRGTSWPFENHPDDARMNILPYENCNETRKADITSKLAARMGCKHNDEPCKCGDIYQYTSIAPIRERIVKDLKAEAYYLAYRFEGTNGHPEPLPTDKVKNYTREASLMNFIKDAVEDTKALVKEGLGFKSVADFWEKLIEIIKSEKAAGRIGAKFPTSYVRLVSHKSSALKKYQQLGYESLVHGNFGVKSGAAKVVDIAAENKLLSLIEDGRQLDDVYVTAIYNSWAKEAGYKEISAGAVGLWRRKRAAEVDLGRYGKSAYNERHIKQVKGRRASNPMLLWEHDDNNLDFLFQDGKYQFHKYVAIVVADSFNDLILGKSYVQGDVPRQWQVGHAYLDAMYYLRSLTGGWYLPWEIKSDNWANKSLAPFYESIAMRVPAGQGNKHRGYIEQLFGSPHFKRCQQTVSQGNWTANNITARHSGVNPDLLQQGMRDKSRPMIGYEAEQQLEQFFHLAQKMPAFTRNNLNAPSKEATWLEAFNKMHADDKRFITDEHFLMKFGIIHQPKHTDTIMISNRGIEPVIKGTKYSYDLPEPWMYSKLIGAKVQLAYDPYDMSRILVTNNDDIRFVAQSAQLSPRALKDTYTGSRTFLNAILDEKTEQWKTAQDAQEKRKQVANGYAAAEGILKSGVHLKEVMKAAETKLIQPSAADTADYEDLLDDNYDLNDFFNQK